MINKREKIKTLIVDYIMDYRTYLLLLSIVATIILLKYSLLLTIVPLLIIPYLVFKGYFRPLKSFLSSKYIIIEVNGRILLYNVKTGKSLYDKKNFVLAKDKTETIDIVLEFLKYRSELKKSTL